MAFAASFLVGATARAESWNALYVFGDSYSDSGAGYVDGNGPTAVVYLARGLGLPFTYATDPDRAGKSLNFAVSGAQTGEGEGRPIKHSLLGRGMKNQVRDFIARVQSGEIKFTAGRTLFFLAGGINDGELSTATTMAHIREEISDLYAVGARHFLVALIPTIPPCRAVGRRINPAIRSIPAEMPLAGADIRISRWGEYFDEVMTSAVHYGFTNTTDACAGRVLFDEDPTPRGNPDEYYYYHAGHPSTAVHRIVGESLLREAQNGLR